MRGKNIGKKGVNITCVAWHTSIKVVNKFLRERLDVKIAQM